MGNFSGIRDHLEWGKGLKVVLYTLDDAFENELLRPFQFLEVSPGKWHFSKWPPAAILEFNNFLKNKLKQLEL